MNDTDQVTLSLTNRLFVKDKNGNVNEVMSWEVAQSRYFDPTFGGAVIPGQRNVIESTEELDGFDFLDGPRNYSPIVSILRFQHVVGFEWRVDYDPLLGRISNSSFNGNIRLSKYFFSLGHTDVRARSGGHRSQQSDQRSVGGRQSKPQGLERGRQCLLRPQPGHPGLRHHRDDAITPIVAASASNIAATTSACATTRNTGSHSRSPMSGAFGNLRKQERIY